MSISNAAGQAGGTTADAAPAVTRLYTNPVVAGSLIVIGCAKFEAGSTFTAANCTQSAGTAALGAIALDEVRQAGNIAFAVWSAIVATPGTLTMRVAAAASAFFAMGCNELISTIGWDASRREDHNTGAGTATTQATANMTSAGAAVFFGGFALDTSAVMNSWTNNNSFLDIYKEIDGGSHEPGLIIQRIVAAGTTTAPSASDVPDGAVLYVGAAATYREAAGGGGVQSPLMGQILL